jgi:hypothetical protein
MKLRTISDSARHSTCKPLHSMRLYSIRGGNPVFQGYYFLILQNQSNINKILIKLKEHRDLQVPVFAASACTGSTPPATARFTADRMASNEAVMMLLCMPAPNRVRRDRVVISI